MTHAATRPQLRLVLVAPRRMRAMGMRRDCAEAGVGLLHGAADGRLELAGGSLVVHEAASGHIGDAAASADLLVVEASGVDEVRRTVARARLALAAAGRPIADLRIVLRVAVVSAATTAEAIRTADRLGLDESTRAHAIVGTASEVAHRLGELAATGEVDVLDLSPTLGTDLNDDALAGVRALRAVLRDVLPLARDRGIVPVGVAEGARAALGLDRSAHRAGAARVAFAIGDTDIPPGW